MSEENKGGRPLMYKTKEELQEKIDEYFEMCKGRILTDDDGIAYRLFRRVRGSLRRRAY